MKPMRVLGFFAAPLALAVLLSLAACNRGDSTADNTNTPPPFSAKLIKALDSSDLEKRLKAELVRRYDRQYDGYIYWGMTTGGGAIMPPTTGLPESTTPTAAGSNADTTYSTTNVQEKGVDEGDLVKTDGNFIYLVRGTHFFVLQATPADQTAIVSDIDLKEYINELHLNGSRVTVITSASITSPIASAGKKRPDDEREGESLRKRTIALGIAIVALAAGGGWYASLDKETRGILAAMPTNADVLMWSESQRDAAFQHP